jgi:hypothetical protein
MVAAIASFGLIRGLVLGRTLSNRSVEIAMRHL